MTTATAIPTIIVRLQDMHLGISSAYISEMLRLGQVTQMPNASPWMRGYIKLRDQAIPAIDLRRLLGVRSCSEEVDELINSLHQREQDHVNWLNELAASLHEGREFKLTTNPHKCAFGKWYDNFRTDNPVLHSILKEFDAPHKRIHGVAEKLIELEQQGEMERAEEELALARQRDLGLLISLFEKAREAIRNSMRETVLVVDADNQQFGMIVDSVMAVEYLEETPEPLPDCFAVEDTSLVTRVSRKRHGNKLLLELDVRQIWGKTQA
jgi:purine-binding chemotaxis protein CheW